MTGDYNEVMSYEGDEFVPVIFKKDRAYAWDAEGFRAGVTVGINFGCIHYEKNACQKDLLWGLAILNITGSIKTLTTGGEHGVRRPSVDLLQQSESRI